MSARNASNSNRRLTFLVLIATAFIRFQAAAIATDILNEQFTDGDLAFGSDPNDGRFVRQAGTSQTIGITSDAVIGGGNAIAYDNPTNGTLFVGQMQSTASLGANLGDRIDASFDFRFTQLPSSPNSSIFRFGLYNHTGATPNDGGSETNPDSGYA